jgi:hypothetical protein
MRRSLVLVALLLVVLASAAEGKEPRFAEVCGATGCREVRDHSLLAQMVEGGPPTSPPREAGAWFDAGMTIAEDRAIDHFQVTVLPGAALIRGDDGTWMRMAESQKRAYARVTRGMRPYSASDMPGSDALDQSRPEVRDQGTPAWPWLAGGGLLLALVLAGVLRRRLA